MHRGNFSRTLFLLVVIGLFVYGLVHLLILRFEKGDVYPRYSSFRSDPLGTKAFYEGLRLLPGIEAARNVEPLQKVSGLSEATLFLFGLQETRFFSLQQQSVKAVDQAALAGGRIVISFVPMRPSSFPPSKESCPAPQDDGEEGNNEAEDLHGKDDVHLTKRWGLELVPSAKGDTEASLNLSEEKLPPSLTWHGTLAFEPQDPEWQVIYARAGKAVIIERPYGKGSIVLSSDSFFLSNEAMKSKRYPQLLSWLCGPHRKIVFDETHLGVSRSPGVATLLRKYGLAPFFISLIVLALLAIWKQAARLVPVYEAEERVSVDPGKDAFTGFVNLLRRNISPDHILSACLEEWKRSFTHGRQNLSALLPRIQEMIVADRARPKRARDPVQVYRKISALGRRR
ncbi:MAG TPA: DUF4350 domain-containing protein [Thermodesulfobacteriota bacterium]|nr:DUF4350 domain-containing protein [Thermodesulfobacteriota bacterium]